jgi:hypothetical protein
MTGRAGRARRMASLEAARLLAGPAAHFPQSLRLAGVG